MVKKFAKYCFKSEIFLQFHAQHLVIIVSFCVSMFMFYAESVLLFGSFLGEYVDTRVGCFNTKSNQII